MNISELEKMLKGTKYEMFIGYIQTVELKNHVYNDLEYSKRTVYINVCRWKLF
jgi:hypothetical protein